MKSVVVNEKEEGVPMVGTKISSLTCCEAQEDLRRARCRRPAVDAGRCALVTHQKRPRAPRPDGVLLRFPVNDRAVERLTAAGVEVRQPVNPEAADRRQAEEAKKIGVSPRQYRQKADAGCAVFGSGGLKGATLSGLLEQLGAGGYAFTEAYLTPPFAVGRHRFTVVVENGGDPGAVPMGELLPMMADAWVVHVWANPEDDSGRVTHTVNAVARGQEKKSYRLIFADGLWGAEPA